MQLTGPNDGREGVFGSFTMVTNVWYREDLAGLDCRGMCCSIVINPALLNLPTLGISAATHLGKAVVLDRPEGGDIGLNTIGVLESHLINRIDNVRKNASTTTGDDFVPTRVLVQLYGYHDALVVRNSVTSSDAFLFDQGASTGMLEGFTLAEIDSAHTITGVVSISGTPAILSLDGGNTATTTWVPGARPQVDPLTGWVVGQGSNTTHPAPSSAPVALMFAQTPSVADALLAVAGGARTPGFVMRMGLSPGMK